MTCGFAVYPTNPTPHPNTLRLGCHCQPSHNTNTASKANQQEPVSVGTASMRLNSAGTFLRVLMLGDVLRAAGRCVLSQAGVWSLTGAGS